MKLTITNDFNNRGKVETNEIDIRNCQITAYEEEYLQYGLSNYTIAADDNSLKIKLGDSIFEDENKINVSIDEYNVFSEFAAQDSHAGDITEDDLRIASETINQENSKLAEIGVLSIEYKDGVAVVKIKGNQILRFEFSKSNKTDEINETEPETEIDNNTSEDITDEVTDVPETIEDSPITPSPMNVFYSNIPKSYDSYIKRTADATGLSENFIRYLVYMEGKNSKAKLNAYQLSSGGNWVIGFGHTNYTDNAKNGNNNFTESKDTSITISQAFEFLVADINEHKEYCEHYLGKYFNEAPSYIQESIIDCSFLAGPGRINKQALKDNLKKRNYADVLKQDLWLTSESRRSGYRFLYAASQMNPKEQSAAKNKFISSGRYNAVLNSIKQDSEGKDTREKIAFKAAFESLGN